MTENQERLNRLEYRVVEFMRRNQGFERYIKKITKLYQEMLQPADQSKKDEEGES